MVSQVKYDKYNIVKIYLQVFLGMTPTLWAAFEGKLDALRLLIGRGYCIISRKCKITCN